MLISQKRPIKKFSSKASQQAGLTLIESVVAIAVIGITVAVASPVVVLSVATRIQNQRAEQAWRLAQSEIDNVRLLVERGGDYSADIAVYPITPEANVQDTGAPTGFTDDLVAIAGNPLLARETSIDEDDEPEFAVQVFRTAGVSPLGTPGLPIGFEFGVRVYDHRAAGSTLADGDALEINEARLGLTGPGSELNEDGSTSGGSIFGNRSTQPLAVVYTRVLQGERDGAGDYCEYWRYLADDPTFSTDGLNCS